MSIETGLGAYLVANVPLAGTRVHAVKLPQIPTFPALTFFRVSTVPLYSHQGFSSYTVCRFQVSGWAQGYTDVREMAQEVRDALDGYSGMMDGTRVYYCLCVGDFDISEPEVKLFQAPQDYKIAYK